MSCLVSGWWRRFINLYASQGLLAELAATFHISTMQASGSIIATNLAVVITAPFVGRLTAWGEHHRGRDMAGTACGDGGLLGQFQRAAALASGKYSPLP